MTKNPILFKAHALLYLDDGHSRCIGEDLRQQIYMSVPRCG
jgi:hypothetical protein